MPLLTEQYAEQITGVLSCYDRIVIQGTLPGFCYAQGMTSFLNVHKIRIFDYPRFAEPLRDELRSTAEQIAKDNGLEIEFIRKKNIRKESLIQDILKKRGHHPGLVNIFSAMESCPSYKPWHNKQTHQTYLKPTEGKCLHYYFYFIDEELGLCYMRVPTWCPFRLQFYFNGHNWLASTLLKENIKFTLMDNAFVNIDSFAHAQSINDSLNIDMLREKLDTFAETYCPIIKKFNLQYHWSIMQVEYATDIVFKRQEELHNIYEHIVRVAIHTVKPDNIATFLGRKLHGNYQDEMGNNFNTRIMGARIKHTMGPVSIKMYDKFSLILRIETTVNNVSFFKHYRKVEHRNGTCSMKLAQMKKSIYSLSPLRKILFSSNQRYLQFISSIEDVSCGVDSLKKVSQTATESNRSYKGFNFFSQEDQMLFEAIASGEFTISGFQNKHLRNKIKGKNSSQISRIIKRLRIHGLIKNVGHTYKYYLTKFGCKIINMGLKLKELVVIPELAGYACTI